MHADDLPRAHDALFSRREDGNLWILRTTSAQTSPGLLYDVVNRKEQLFQRVRVPPDRVVIGHGKGASYICQSMTRQRNHGVLKRPKFCKVTMRWDALVRMPIQSIRPSSLSPAIS